jgi:hypothetical protein
MITLSASAMKCALCSGKIETTFLNKIMGTFVKDAKGKKMTICFECQKKHPSKKDVLDAIK